MSESKATEAERAVWISAMRNHIVFWKRQLEKMSPSEQDHFTPLVRARLDTVKMVERRAAAIRDEQRASQTQIEERGTRDEVESTD